jgi:hypothetical protein
MKILKPGIYEIGEDCYHADPCPNPSLSHSIAKMLLHRSPRHAWAAHPRLGNLSQKPANSAMDDGSIIHKLILGKGSEIEVCDFKDWRKDAAKEARDIAREEGRIPVLAGDMPGLEACAKTALEQMRDHPDLAAFFEAGKSEAVIAWRESARWCRGMVDRLPDGKRVPIFDIKTTGQSAAPEAWERRLVHEYATQSAFYRRGLHAIRGVEPGPMLFVVIETEAPYCISVITPAPSLAAYADREIERALEVWNECMTDDVWPGYPAFTAHVDLPGYMAMREEERAIWREFLTEHFDPNNAFAQEFQE